MPAFSAPHAPRDSQPRPSSTVVLLRPGPICPEVYLLRRSRGALYLGGALVFPGGQVDPADRDPALVARSRRPRGLSRGEALGFVAASSGGGEANPPAGEAGLGWASAVAAARELFEESGVLLARPISRVPEAEEHSGPPRPIPADRAAAPPDPEASLGGRAKPEERPLEAEAELSPVIRLDGALGERLLSARPALHSGEVSFLELLTREALELATDQLAYFAHWITPSTEPRRFDTRFFAARMPEGQLATSDGRETVEGRWLTPLGALEAHARREAFLAPPTLRVLEELKEARSVEEALAAAESRPVATLLPKMAVAAEGRVSVILPWHPRYVELEGEGLDIPEASPDRRFSAEIEVPIVITPGGPPAEGSTAEGRAAEARAAEARAAEGRAAEGRAAEGRAEEGPAPAPPDEALALLNEWFGPDLSLCAPPPEIASRWWKKDPVFDEHLRTRFGDLRERAAAGALDGWTTTPQGTLALVILLDQLSRNLFRGSPRAFESDARALSVAEAAIERGDDTRLSPMTRAFLYLPLMHAEDLGRQRQCLLAFERLVEAYPALEPSLRASREHLEIIERFGRFPHRNETLGRPCSPEEEAWLASGHRGF